ncbi:sulfatase [Seonamhaeicola sp.]|uniref:sulfatase family protein n=1 Tax=Seonamhaeicola sp. TaxID=1912245 RepID=UPI0026058B1C|nr:sulfatase [Seonamhaeicola sp.]
MINSINSFDGYRVLSYLLLISISCSGQITKDFKKKPNILFIMSDDHTTQAIGAYGSRLAGLNPTPTLDELANNGMLFTNTFCTNSICTPSRATIMTGQYSQTNKVLDLDGALPGPLQFLPKEVKKLGYETAIIGKWHLKEEPTAFDYYKVLPGQGDYFDPVFRVDGEKAWPNSTIKYNGHSSDVITDQSIEWLSSRDSEKPFFLMHHFKAPHDMFEYAPRYEQYMADIEIPEPESMYNQPRFGSEATRGKNDSLINLIGSSISKRHGVRNYVDYYKIDSSLPKDEQTHLAYQKYLKNYLRCVKGIDDNLARLFNYLKQSGQWENTIIIYTGDQGFMLGEHDYMDKRWAYEESMRMPLIIRHPYAVKKGVNSNILINNTDFAPTLIDMAGGTVPNYMHGRSIVPVLNSKEPDDWRKSTYYRYWMHLEHHDIPAHMAIRSKEFKLIFYYGLPSNLTKIGRPSLHWETDSNKIVPTPPAWEFYDLRNDPYELVNQYKNEVYAEEILELKVELKNLRREFNEGDENYPHIAEIINKNWNK